MFLFEKEVSVDHGHMPQVLGQSHMSANGKGDNEIIPGCAFTLRLNKTQGRPSNEGFATSRRL